jgi:hypothetical protein
VARNVPPLAVLKCRFLEEQNGPLANSKRATYQNGDGKGTRIEAALLQDEKGQTGDQGQ